MFPVSSVRIETKSVCGDEGGRLMARLSDQAIICHGSNRAVPIGQEKAQEHLEGGALILG